MNKNISLPPISDIFQSGVPDPFAPRLMLPYASPYHSYEYSQAHMMAPRGVYPGPSSLLHHKHSSTSPAPLYFGTAVGASPRGSVSSNDSSSVSSDSTPHAVSPNMAPSHIASGTRAKTRNNLPKETTYILLKWLNEHLSHPYPNSFEKTQLMVSTGLNQQQLSNWFINARRRKIKNLRHSQSEKTA